MKVDAIALPGRDFDAAKYRTPGTPAHCQRHGYKMLNKLSRLCYLLCNQTSSRCTTLRDLLLRKDRTAVPTRLALRILV